MAKILLGPTVIGIRGTVAGITFSQNRAGPYARGWHTPPFPKTGKQRTAQNSLASWSVLWRSLTLAQQTTWNVYAAAAPQQLLNSLGQPYFASGFNWYITTNTNLAQIGSAAVLVAPVAARPAAPINTNLVFRATPTVGSSRWQFAVGDPTLGLYHQLWAAVVNSTGILVAPKKYYYMNATIPNVNRQCLFKTESEAKFGTIFIGQKCFARVRNIGADGQTSSFIYNSANAI